MEHLDSDSPGESPTAAEAVDYVILRLDCVVVDQSPLLAVAAKLDGHRRYQWVEVVVEAVGYAKSPSRSISCNRKPKAPLLCVANGESFTVAPRWAPYVLAEYLAGDQP